MKESLVASYLETVHGLPYISAVSTWAVAYVFDTTTYTFAFFGWSFVAVYEIIITPYYMHDCAYVCVRRNEYVNKQAIF